MSNTKFYVASVFSAALILLIAILSPAFNVNALSSSSLLISDSRPSQTGVDYTFSTSGLDTGTTINCIQLDIGTAVDGTGDAGLTVGSATLGANTIPSSGSWVVGTNEGNDQLQATLVAGATPNATGSITWQNVTNGSTADTTYFGLFETYANTDCSTGGPVDSVVVTLRFTAGTLVSLTIDPTLTFTVAGVAEGGPTVNSAAITQTSTATAIDFQNEVTSLANGVSAHDLTAGTNASGGYALYIRHTGLLTNGASDTIDLLAAATNAAPAAFSAAGTEAWGYTTEDATLGGGTADRFTNPANQWAAFNTTNEIVADGTASSTTRVGHQVGVAASTEAGTYQTTITYTAASTY